MKKVFLGFLILAVLTLIGVLFAAGDDHYNQGTVTVWEDGDQVNVRFVVILASGADTTGQWHSKPIYIADCNANDGYAYCVQGAAGDVNVKYHYSVDDKTTWLTEVAPLALDQVSNTVKIDTMGAGTSDDTRFHFARYLVVELDGQTANASNTITFYATFKKDASLVVNEFIPMGNKRVSTGSVSNP